MINVCVSWIDWFDLKRFAAGGDYYGPLIAFLRSEHFSNIDELHVIVSKKTKYFEFAEQFFEHIKSNYFANKKIVCHVVDVCSNDMVRIGEIFKKSIDEIINKYSDINFLLNVHLGIGTFSARISMELFDNQLNTIMTSYDKTKKEFITDTWNRADESDTGLGLYLYNSLIKDNKFIDEGWKTIPEYESITYRSSIMYYLFEKAYILAQYDIPVLILGESGTGKELFAQVIHKASKRADKELKILNCAAIHGDTANATLFGWSKGAFTGARGEGKGIFLECDEGTVFLDEIGDLSLETQTKLLRVIQNGEVQRLGDGKTFKVDVRLITATNKNLIKLVNENKFLEDFYYRIEVGIIKLPPLRERDKDSIVIAKQLFEQTNESNAKSIDHYIPKEMTDSAYEFIGEYKWPGNVRELLHTIKRACMSIEDDLIDAEDIKGNLSDLLERSPQEDTAELKKDYSLTLDELTDVLKEVKRLKKGNHVNLNKMTKDFRKGLILEALKLAGNNQRDAAFLLGYNNSQTLNAEMKRLGIGARKKKL